MVEKVMHSKNRRFYTKQTILTSLLFLFSAHCKAEVSVSANLFLGRSFSANSAREMMMTGPTNQDTNHDAVGFIAIDGAYQRAWNQSANQGIGAYPFWSEINTMTVGSNTTDTHVDAYQFGLGPVTTTGSMSLNPIIYQGGSDVMFYVRSQQYGHSFFAKIKSALTAMIVNPGLTEIPVTPVVYPAGAIPIVVTPPSTQSPITNPSTSMTQAFAGITGGQLVEGSFIPMRNGLINGIQSTGAHLSDTEMTIGYNYLSQETDNTVSFGARVTAPTGKKPEGVYILEPINGRGGYWGAGFYLACTYGLWHNTSRNSSLQLNFMSNGIHLCGADVIRSYDLTENGHGSKYLLVADYHNNVFQNNIQNLVNLSTLTSRSSFAFEGDAALAMSWTSGGFSADLGYNAWGRTRETLTIQEKFATQRYAILGRQVVATSAGDFSTLAQPTATIHASIDALGGIGAANANGIAVDATIPTNRIGGNADFDTTITAQYAAVTSKLFAKIGYAWKESNCCPYLNLMSSCEWSNISNNALPQWSIALIGGISL